jgi:hypothetical protein
MSFLNHMKKEEKTMNAQLETLKSIQEHLQSFASVSELWKKVAKASAELAFIQRTCDVGELDDISDLINHVVCLLEVLEPIEKGGKA